MRLIGSLKNFSEVEQLSSLLGKANIDHQIEQKQNDDWGNENYGNIFFLVWILDEDDVYKGEEILSSFLNSEQNQSSSPFEKPPLPSFERRKKTIWMDEPLGNITLSFILICLGLFAVSAFMTPSFFEKSGKKIAPPFFVSPIKKVLLYDYPKAYELANELWELYGIKAFQNPESLSLKGQILFQELSKTNVWQGIYSLIMEHHSFIFWPWMKDYSLFQKIRQGQVWRTFTPSLLHGDIFHLFFNMIWLFILGKQMEQKLPKWKYLFFILVVGIVSNTAQYLMSGANFLGFSGILSGMIGFIWIRQKKAPWEGYPLEKVTINMLAFFILGLFAIQLVSFFAEFFSIASFSLGIANTCHLVGGILGIFLGSLSFFSWKTRTRIT